MCYIFFESYLAWELEVPFKLALKGDCSLDVSISWGGEDIEFATGGGGSNTDIQPPAFSVLPICPHAPQLSATVGIKIKKIDINQQFCIDNKLWSDAKLTPLRFVMEFLKIRLCTELNFQFERELITAAADIHHTWNAADSGKVYSLVNPMITFDVDLNESPRYYAQYKILGRPPVITYTWTLINIFQPLFGCRSIVGRILNDSGATGQDIAAGLAWFADATAPVAYLVDLGRNANYRGLAEDRIAAMIMAEIPYPDLPASADTGNFGCCSADPRFALLGGPDTADCSGMYGADATQVGLLGYDTKLGMECCINHDICLYSTTWTPAVGKCTYTKCEALTDTDAEDLDLEFLKCRNNLRSKSIEMSGRCDAGLSQCALGNYVDWGSEYYDCPDCLPSTEGDPCATQGDDTISEAGQVACEKFAALAIAGGMFARPNGWLMTADRDMDGVYASVVTDCADADSDPQWN